MSGSDWGASVPLDDISGQVAIVGVGESDHSRASNRTAIEIVGQATDRALEDAGLAPGDVDGLMYHPYGEPFTAQHFHARYGTRHDLWVSESGGGMHWAGSAPYQAAAALRSGRATCVLNTFGVAWATRRGDMTGGPGEPHSEDLLKRHLELPMGWFPQPVYFASVARRHMIDFGTTHEQLGSVAVCLRRHANHNRSAVMRDRTLTLEEYLEAPMLADPFRVPDCCLISDGGGAYLMTSPERARDLRKPVVEVAGLGIGRSRSGSYWAQQPAFTSTPQTFSAKGAFAMAGIEAKDLDVLTCYDPFTIHTIMCVEDMGFCGKGEGGPFVESGALAFDSGTIPYNTHGGHLSHAYVLGIAHVVETVRQLRGEADAQVEAAETGAYAGYTGAETSTLVLRRRG
jgi:acetyl-CoA acetyltransferase